MKNLKLITFIAFFLGFRSLVFSQEGNKYLHNFTPFDYNASDQNWSSVQDKNGFIYVANLLIIFYACILFFQDCYFMHWDLEMSIW